MAQLQKDLNRMKGATLTAAVGEADSIVSLLEAARDQVANGKTGTYHAPHVAYGDP